MSGFSDFGASFFAALGGFYAGSAIMRIALRWIIRRRDRL